MKVLLLDADGVVLEKKEYFSERFSKEQSVPLDKVLEFFKGPYVLCQKGDADLKEELQPFLIKWNWGKSVEEFLNYWFLYDVVLNIGIEDALLKFKDEGVKCYLASNNEKYRATIIKKKLSETGLLDGFYFSYNIKNRKNSPVFFTYILKDLSVNPNDVYFVDNDQENVDSAASVGIKACLYKPEILNHLLQPKT